MAEKKPTKRKTAPQPAKVNREARRARTMNIIFLVITAIVIFSMIAMAVAK